jgi:uncharacterized protein YydD (DUF2326 family)
METTPEQFDKIKSKGEEFYKTLGEIYCPYFQEKIVFNAKGLEHLKFKKKNHARQQEDQLMRFKILKHAPKILELSKTVQGISEQKVFELNRSNHRNEYLMVDAMYYEFVAVLDHVRVMVVVKQIGNVPKYFWSIIPFWKNNKQNGKRKLHYGHPEED